MSCEYIDPVVGHRVWPNMWNAVAGLPANTEVNCYLIDDREIIFEAQAGITPITQADVGSNAQFSGQSNPNGHGISQAFLTSVATTDTLPFRIVGMGQRAGNDPSSSYNTVEVVINGPGSGGEGPPILSGSVIL